MRLVFLLLLFFIASCGLLDKAERKSDIITYQLCVFGQCTLNETDKGANQETVDGGLNKSELQEIEQSIESTLKADIKAK